MDQAAPAPAETFLVARLPARVGPLIRGELYEDPLADLLDPTGIAEVTGGGTMMAEGGDIKFVDLEICVQGDLAPVLDDIAAALEKINVPRGTELIDDNGTTLRTCGTRAIAGLALDGVSLPQEVYDSCSADDVLDAMLDAMGPGHGYAGFHAMAETTVLYFFGDDYATMEKAMKKRMPKVPLCQNAELRQIA
ncbi:MAG: hypothetical protein KJO78_09575 [Alphaproteobacteria bacterium]|jgi:hypothetical protein|nr:hypothetical protein [Alphaproteobacteria bacterium]